MDLETPRIPVFKIREVKDLRPGHKQRKIKCTLSQKPLSKEFESRESF
jgi:hypothetical protein